MKQHTNLNPHLGKRTWNERYGDRISEARSWRLAAILSLCLALLSMGAFVWLSGQSQIVPYVVQVDKLGAAVAVNRADEAQKPDKPMIVAQLARWIANVRSVYVDAAAERSILKEGYALVNRRGDAYTALNDYMRAHDPFERAKSETVTIEVETVLPVAGDTWRIEWREETRSRDGTKPVSQQMQATVSLSFNPPSDEATIRINPLGLYVDAFNWTQRL